MQENFTSSSGAFHVPTQPMSIPSPRGMISRDSCLQPDKRNSLGTSRHVFEGVLARGEPSSAPFQIWKHSASSSCRLMPLDTGRQLRQQGEGLRKEPQNHRIPTPRFARKFLTWNPFFRTEGTCPRNCMMQNPMNQISDLQSYGSCNLSRTCSFLEAESVDVLPPRVFPSCVPHLNLHQAGETSTVPLDQYTLYTDASRLTFQQ